MQCTLSSWSSWLWRGGGWGVEVFTGHLHPNKSDAFPVAFPRVVIAAWSLLVSQARGRLHNFLWPLQSYCAGSWEFSLHSCDHIIIIKIIKLNLSLSSLWTTYYHYHHYRVDVQLLKKTLWPKPSLLWLESSGHSFPSREQHFPEKKKQLHNLQLQPWFCY